MNASLKVEFIVPSNCPADIELMAIWSQAAERYIETLSANEFQAAVTWFQSYIESKTQPQDSAR